MNQQYSDELQHPSISHPGYVRVFALGPGGSIVRARLVPASSSRVRHDLDVDLADDDAHHSSSRSRKRARAGAAEETILGLPEVTARSRSGEECAVCLQGFCAGETLRAMPCSHAFHHHCISQWLRRKAVCPLCRHQLLPEEEQQQQRRRRTVTAAS